jgi:hypothetical protein
VRPAILFANGLGDHLLALPALRALSEILPGPPVLLTGEGPTEILFAGVELASTVKLPMEVDRYQRTFDGRRAAALVSPIDLLVSLVPWHSDSVRDLLVAAEPCTSVGFHSDFDTVLPLDHSRHSADLTFDAVRHFRPDAPFDAYAFPLELPRSAVMFAADLRSKLGAQKLLVVHAETKTEKRYPPLRMQEALHAFLDQHPDYAAMVVGHREAAFDASAVGASMFEAIGIPTSSFVALIAAADLFLGVDSFGLHVADLWRVPAVGLFGPTSADEFGFRFSAGFRQLQGRGTMSDIGTQQVVGELAAMALSVGTAGQLPAGAERLGGVPCRPSVDAMAGFSFAGAAQEGSGDPAHTTDLVPAPASGPAKRCG